MTVAAPDRPLHADPDFVRYWLTGSPFLTGLVAALEAVPYLCFGLLAGAVADRVDRRRLMVAADLVSAAVVGSVPVAAGAHALTTVHVLAAAALAATVFDFFDAANFGALPTLVGTGRLPSANSAVWGAGTAVEIVVPAAAGAAFALVSPTSVPAVDAATFVASALLLRAIIRPLSDPPRAVPVASRGDWGADVREGLAFL